MCVPRVPTRPKFVNRETGRTGSRYSGSDAPRNRQQDKRAKRQQRQAEEHARHRQRLWKDVQERFAGDQGARSAIYSLELGSSHTHCRRTRARQHNLVLSDRQRERCRMMLAATAACGTSFGAYRRFTPVESGWLEERLVCQHWCGTRACARCDAEIRQRECWRVEGPWRQFVTLGIPSGGLSIRQAWFRVRKARALLFKRMERHAARPDAWAVRVWPDDAQAARDHRARTSRGRVRRSDLDYAWTLEPHVSGFPHIHFVTNTCYINYTWLRATWSACVGRVVQWCKVKQVTSRDGVCRYLSKYISKTTFTLDLCALLYRQRMWATTRPLPPDTSAGWLAERETDGATAARHAEEPGAFTAEPGWSAPEGSKGRYQRWKRAWPMLDAVDPWLMMRYTAHRYDPERQVQQDVFDRPPSDAEWGAVMDTLLEVSWLWLSGRWSGSGLARIKEHGHVRLMCFEEWNDYRRVLMETGQIPDGRRGC